MNVLRLKQIRPALFLSLLGSATAGVSAAQPPVPDSLMECALVSDDLGRLACFDRELARLAPAAESAPAAATPEPELVDEFGMTAELASKSAGKETDNKPKELTAVVVAVRKRPHGEHVVTLDNGQVWAQKRARSGFLLKEGDTATIRRGAFGSYRLTGRGNRAFEVKRIE